MTTIAPPIRGAGRPSRYTLAAGPRVPGVTTITGHYKSQGLLIWANNEGLEGRSLYERRDEAAEAGSIAHKWIEDTLHGQPLTVYANTDADVLAKARMGLAAFREWLGHVDLTLLETEVPLVSEQYRYGGTLDALATINGNRVLLDWKTSGGAYPDYIGQVAAYRQLLRERDGDLAPKSALLLRLGKEHADFHYNSYPETVLDLGWEWFQHMRGLYELDKVLKKLAA